MEERQLETIVNPKLATCLRERKNTRKQVEQSEIIVVEEQPQGHSSDDENLAEEEDQACVETVPAKVFCAIDKTVKNTIVLLRYRRNLEKLINDVYKDLHKRKLGKLPTVSNIKVTDGMLVPVDAPKLPFNEESQESFLMDTLLLCVPDSDDWVIESDESISADDVCSEDEDTDDRFMSDMKIWPPWPPCPPLPKLRKVKKKRKTLLPVQEIPNYDSPFSRGKGRRPLALGHKNVHSILEKCVITLLVHFGWQDASRQALDLIIDLTEEFLFKMTKLLRVSIDNDLGRRVTRYPVVFKNDVLERVLVEMGVGGIRGVVEDYQLRVLNYNINVYESCLEAMDEYKALTEATQEDIISELECKIDDEDVDVPEIHFPALGEGYGVDELQPSLEPGFQMLHSLEQEEQLQNLETEEHMNMGESLTQESQMSSFVVAGSSTKSSRIWKQKKT